MDDSSNRLPDPIIRRWTSVLTLVTGCLLAACASVAPSAAPATPKVVAAAPATADFASGLRCMDNLLQDFGVHDLSMAVEAPSEPAQREHAAVRGLLVAAFSDMTQRSLALRVTVPGGGAPDAGSAAPRYRLRSSAATQPGHTGSAVQARLGLSLTVLTQGDLSVVPGTATRNEVLITVRGSDRRAELHKLGRSFAVAPRSDAYGDGWRALTQVAAIELVGRLARLPYWTCLGVAADETLGAEMQDWYDAMATRPSDLIAYFQQQLRQRRAYEGPTDGAANEAFRNAVARYRAALGLSAEPKLSLDLFTAYLTADHQRLAATLTAPSADTTVQAIRESQAGRPSSASVAPDLPSASLALRVAPAGSKQLFKRGEALQLSVRPSRRSHVYCYLQDENRTISRFFPNRFQPDARVNPETGLQLPGAMRFQIVMNPRGAVETVSCFATDRDVLPELPAALAGGDFQPLKAATLDQLRSAFARASGGNLAYDSFELRARP